MPPGCGSFWPRGQTLVRAGDPDRARSGRRCAVASTATPSRAAWSAPSRLRVPSGKTNRTWPSSRMRWASRNASTSAASRSTGWTPPLRAIQPTTGQSNSSFLPSQWIRRPSLGISHEPSTTASRFEAWFAARMTRTVARDLVDRALDPDPASWRGRRPGSEGHGPDERRHRALDRLGAAWSPRRRRRREWPASWSVSRRASASRIAFDDRLDRVLEAVAVGRDDPGVRSPAGAARPRGSRSSSSRRRSASRIASASGPSGSRPRSSARRRARSSTEASRKILRSASGRTTVPMSRPAMTIPPARARSRWRSSSAARSSGMADTADTAASTSGRGRHRCDRPRRRGRGRAGPARPARARPRRRARSAPPRRPTSTPRCSAEPGHRAVEQARVAEPVADVRGRRGAPTLLLPDEPGRRARRRARAARSTHRPSAAG